MDGVRRAGDGDVFLPLSAKNVVSISLAAKLIDAKDPRTHSSVHSRADVKTSDGKTHPIFDIWFKQLDRNQCAINRSYQPTTQDPTSYPEGFSFDGPGHQNGCCYQLDPCGNCNVTYDHPMDDWFKQPNCSAEIRAKYNVVD